MDGKVTRCFRDGQQKTDINQIMLRFRPIAPKPANDGAGSSAPASTVLGKKKRRGRRKGYARVSNSDSANKSNHRTNHHDGMGAQSSASPAKEEEDQTEYCANLNDGPASGSAKEGIKTLRLLPMEDGKSPITKSEEELEREQHHRHQGRPLDLTAKEIQRCRRRVLVVVLSLTDGDTSQLNQGVAEGSTDEEKLRSLEEDACPGFISDASNRVQWSNAAFRRMVGERNHEDQVEMDMEVEVKVKKGLAVEGRPAYSCLVQVEYGNRWQKGSSGQGRVWKWEVVPCDVWRMECGGFVWRLDVKAALSLGF